MKRAELREVILAQDNDGAEITRQALVLARELAGAVAKVRADQSALQIAHLRRSYAEVLEAKPLTIDLSSESRTELAAILEHSLAPHDGLASEFGFLGVAAHELALALEEVFGSRFFEYLAASGDRFLSEDELLPRSIQLSDPSSAFRQHYGRDLGTDPSRLRPPAPGELARYGALAPRPPHDSVLRWLPSWDILDELEPGSLVAALFPVNFVDLDVPASHDSGAGPRFFGVRPRDPQAACAAALDLLREADEAGASLVVFPELCLDRSAIDSLADWVESEAQNILVAVCGSCHEETDELGRSNNAIVASSDRRLARVVQPKIRPFQYNGADEDIRHAKPTINLFSSRRWSLVTPICIDFFDGELAEYRERIAPTLALVPACSESTGPLAESAAHLAVRVQAHVVIANQNVPPAEGHAPPFLVAKARPVRSYGDVITEETSGSVSAPTRRVTRLCRKEWEEKY